MKKTSRRGAASGKSAVGEMRAEYDFSEGVRGKYAGRLEKGAAVVVLDPDIARAFPTSEDVNTALRALLTIVPSRRRRK